jgi:hypothetical protein
MLKIKILALALVTTGISALALEPDYKGSQLSLQKTHALEDYKGLHFVFVPGFLYDAYHDFSKTGAGSKLALGQYFDDTRAALKKAGVMESVAELNAQDSIFNNASDLAAMLNEIPGPVVIVSHSKGGLETLETLLEYPFLRKKIALWISLQTPFYGSQIGDLAYQHDYVRKFAKGLLEKCLGGSLDSLEGLQTELRRDYMNARSTRIAALVSEVPILSVGSWIEGKLKTDENGLPALLSLQLLMTQLGAKENDGLVETTTAQLPGTRFIKISEMDHGDAVMPAPGRKFDRPALLRLLLDLNHASLMKSINR